MYYCFTAVFSNIRGTVHCMYGQPSWWTALDDNTPLTLQPIHCATKCTEANLTLVKSERFSPAPVDSTKRHSTAPVKTSSFMHYSIAAYVCSYTEIFDEEFNFELCHNFLTIAI